MLKHHGELRLNEPQSGPFASDCDSLSRSYPRALVAASVLFADGSVRFLTVTEMLEALAGSTAAVEGATTKPGR